LQPVNVSEMIRRRLWNVVERCGGQAVLKSSRGDNPVRNPQWFPTRLRLSVCTANPDIGAMTRILGSKTI